MNLIWKLIAKFLAQPKVVDWLIGRAVKTPYSDIIGSDGKLYMERFWLFNPYPTHDGGQNRKWKFPISIRLHHILQPDQDRDLHDHPWNARTIILRNEYWEIRERMSNVMIVRKAGETATLQFGEYHRIVHVHPYGVWTLFITGKYQGTWGFLVNGTKVQWKKYLGIEK